MDTVRHQGINATTTLRLTRTITTTIHIIISLISRIINSRTITTILHQLIHCTMADNGIAPNKLTTMACITIIKLRQQGGLWRKKLARIGSHGEEIWQLTSTLGKFMAAPEGTIHE